MHAPLPPKPGGPRLYVCTVCRSTAGDLGAKDVRPWDCPPCVKRGAKA